MKEVDLIFCKDCRYFTRWHVKADGSDDMVTRRTGVCGTDATETRMTIARMRSERRTRDDKKRVVADTDR